MSEIRDTRGWCHTHPSPAVREHHDYDKVLREIKRKRRKVKSVKTKKIKETW